MQIVGRKHKKNVIDFDAKWIEHSAAHAKTVGEVMVRYDQFKLKVDSLQKRYPESHDLYRYGERAAAFIGRLKTYSWDVRLADAKRNDVLLRSLRF